MKSFIRYIYLILVVVCFAGCDTEGDIIDTSFSTLSVSFVYPSDAREIYDIFVNEEKLEGGTAYFKGNEAQLDIYEKNSGELEFSKKAHAGEIISLIKLPGVAMDEYSEDTYSQITVKISNQDGEPLSSEEYSAYFSEQELSFDSRFGSKNYIRNDKLENGTFKLCKKETGEVLYEQGNITLQPNGNLTVMENSTAPSGYIYFPPSDVEPEDNYHPLIRFVYFNDNFPEAAQIKFKLYAYNRNSDPQITPLEAPNDEIVLTAGLISDYVSIDLNKYFDGARGGSVYLQITKVKEDGTEVVLTEAEDKVMTSASATYKYVTYVLTNKTPEVPDDELEPKNIKCTTALERVKWE